MADALTAVQTLERDLREVFGSRLQSLVQYGRHARPSAAHDNGHGGNSHHHEPELTHTLVIVDTLTPDDLRGCAARIQSWHDASLATPLVMSAGEFSRSLDVFPFEFSSILANHDVVYGRNPFDGLRIETADLRWACEVQARGHLLHLRQGYVEARGRGDALAVLIVRSAPAWASLLQNLARLDGVTSNDVTAAVRHAEHTLNLTSGLGEIVSLVGVKEITSEHAVALFPSYLQTVERLTKHVDTWSAVK
jgi:hypothetical protein